MLSELWGWALLAIVVLGTLLVGLVRRERRSIVALSAIGIGCLWGGIFLAGGIGPLAVVAVSLAAVGMYACTVAQERSRGRPGAPARTDDPV